MTTADGPTDDRRTFNQNVIENYRANGGALTIAELAGADLILLTTIGAHSGQPHATPLGYAEDAMGRLIVYASNMAAPQHPDWYYNLLANPEAVVEHGSRRFPVKAHTTTGTERDIAYRALTNKIPHIGGHQAQTEREIPLLLLEPTD
jgi:deazaflavin-dependent oxidoreductase (nitroreductase family)